tara:strand:- start:260 stop:802 length:543 start_codon:yes stop_codon:yes gene_type:complete
MTPLDTIAFIPQLIFGAISFEDYTSFNYYKHLDPIGKEIMERVDSSENITYWPKENLPSCKSGNNEIWFGYVTYPDFFDSSDFVICTYNIRNHFGNKEFLNQINSTVRHEATHSAQFCKGGNNLLGVDQRKFSGYPYERVYGPNSIYKKDSYEVKLMELEAFALESEPYIVLRSLDRFCF